MSLGTALARRPQWGPAGRLALHVLGIAAFGLLMIVAWQVFVWLELVSEQVVPSPGDTGAALGDSARNFFNGGPVLDATVITMTEVLAGFAIAAVTGVILGLIAGDTRFGRRILMPYLVAINAAPKVAFAPIFVAWLGFGMGPKVLMAVVIAFFPIVINTALGVQSATVNQLLLFQSAEATRLQTLRYLKIPTALPSIFASLRLAIVLCVVGAIVGEFLGGNAQGLGELIRVAHQNIAVDEMFALIIVLSAMSIALYALMSLLERRVLRWRADERAQNARASG